MSLWSTYKNLSPKARLYVGLGVIAWGSIGLYMSDVAEQKLGYTPTEADKEQLARMTPRIHVVDRDK